MLWSALLPFCDTFHSKTAIEKIWCIRSQVSYDIKQTNKQIKKYKCMDESINQSDSVLRWVTFKELKPALVKKWFDSLKRFASHS